VSTAAARRWGALVFKSLAGRAGPFSVEHVRMDPGSRTPPLHHARTAEFILVLKGGKTARLGSRRLRLRPGDCAYLPPGTIHEFVAGPRGVEVLTVFSPPLNFANPDVVLASAAGAGGKAVRRSFERLRRSRP
jgi:quercetin dioxygenase-like cupin family protein